MEAARRRTDELLERLYDAATCSVEWRDFLRDYAAELAADGAVLVDAGDDRESTPPLAACFGFRNELTPLARDLALRDISTHRAEIGVHENVYVCESTLCDAKDIDPRICHELLEPAGLEQCYCLRVLRSRSPTRYRCVTAMRKQMSGPFTESDMRLASMLAPHIDRAITIYAANSRRDFERTAALSMLEWLGIGIAIVVDDGTVRYLNQEARHIFSLDDGLSLSANRIQCADPAANRQLESHIRMAIESFDDDEPAGDRSVRVERKSGLSPFALFVIRAPHVDSSLATGGGKTSFASVLISNPERPVVLPPLALRKLYGITPAESRVLEGIISGSTVTELAHRLEVTANTIRAHLKHIYKVTRTKNQADLIRRVMLDIAWMKSASGRGD